MKLTITAHMDGRDVTPWLVEASVEQPRRTLYRQADLTFAGWSNIIDGARWDIFASYDPAEPYAETILAAGQVPPDRVRRVRVGAGELPRVTLTVYDHVWLAQRRTPTETLVLVPDEGGESAAAALEDYPGPVGAYRVLAGVRTLHDAVRRLAHLAGFRVQILLPNADMAPLVVDPSSSLWEAIVELLTPWSPRTRYDRHNNTLIFSDPLGAAYAAGRTLTIPADGVRSIDGWPTRYARTRRVIVRVPIRE